MAQCNTTFVFRREHNAHMPCETDKFTNVWPRRPQQGFILPPNIRLNKHSQCSQLLQNFLSNSFSSHFRNCTVCHTVFMLLYVLHCIALHCITDNTCNNYIAMPSMDFHKRTGLMYKPDKLQLRTSHYKGPQRGRLSKQIKYLGN